MFVRRRGYWLGRPQVDGCLYLDAIAIKMIMINGCQDKDGGNPAMPTLCRTLYPNVAGLSSLDLAQCPSPTSTRYACPIPTAWDDTLASNEDIALVVAETEARLYSNAAETREPPLSTSFSSQLQTMARDRMEPSR